LAAGDFEALRATMTERWGPVRICNAITRVKSVFRYAAENRLIPRPVEFGTEFKKPDKSVLRRHKATQGVRMLEADDIRTLLEGAVVGGEGGPELVRPTATIKAMILLGINCGFGNADCASLPMSCLDLDGGWVSFPRPKSGIARRAKLWPETVAAIRESLAERTAPVDPADADVVFLQPSGRRWVRLTEKSLTDNLTVRFSEMLKKLGFHRPGIGFYSLRHSFRTAADASCDAVAIDLVMGHTDGSMASHYRERIDDSRLRAVAEHVRAWLFGEAPEDGTTEADRTTPESNDPSEAPQQGNEDNERPILRLFAG
jgi:integrase